MNQNILVVDDNRGVRTFLNELLTLEGYTVRLAASGAQAIQMVQEMKPSVVILDLKMPEMSGVEVFHRLASIIPEVPVILISAYTDFDSSSDLLRTYTHLYYIRKPFDIKDLRTLIKQLLLQ